MSASRPLQRTWENVKRLYGADVELDLVLRGVDFTRRQGPNPKVSGIEYDSRRVQRGSLFVAFRGGTTDGNRYIPQAVAQGAVAIVTDSASGFSTAIAYPDLVVVEVPHGRRALAALAANFFAHPEAQLKLSGVTGTNGKTTTAFLLEAMLRHQGRKTILAGTIEYHAAGRVFPAPHTTPEARDLLELFREGVDGGATEAVMEVSSHALDQERIAGLNFDVAIFTNLTRDHLDYHRTMDCYFAAKRRLFESGPRVAILNRDDPYGTRLKDETRSCLLYTYGMDQGDFHADQLQMDPAGMRFTMVTPQGKVPLATRLTGGVNVYNLLAASAAAMARGLSLEEVAQGAASLDCVPGRFQSVDCGQEFAVVVDYAHTDDALRNIIAVAREFVSKAGGRVITMFGCGGDRDRSKRPLMGQAAGSGSDVVVLTSDNPRGEDPLAIIDQVLPGLSGTAATVIVEPDRQQAIKVAIAQARARDLVLLAGKGHEKTQTIGERVIPFDDVAVARQVLLERSR
jgi:UDP-N-acetylmuramoyl-L-alanyl-D-glutamate--2,6-diaminopimelate ligase